MKHNNITQLFLLFTLFFVTVGIVSVVTLKESLQTTKTEAEGKYSLQTNSVGIAQYENDSKASFFSFSSRNTDSGLYVLEGNTASAVERFISDTPQYSITGTGESGNLVPDSVANLRLIEAFSGQRLNQGLSLSFNDNQFQHYYYTQTRCDVPVYGSYLNAHVTDESEIYSISGALMEGDAICSRVLSEEEIKAAAIEEFEATIQEEAIDAVIEQEYVYNPDLLDKPSGNSYLTKYVRVCSDQYCEAYLVDTGTGDIRHTINLPRDALNRDIRYGSTRRTEGQSEVSNQYVNKAYDIMGQIYNIYSNTFGRDSYNDNGVKIIVEIESFGQRPNAYWDTISTIVADPRLVIDDVLMHEFTHAVTQYTTRLAYQYEPGALNESMSDVFGSMIDRNWEMGEDYGTLRDMSDPTAFGDPDTLFSSNFKCYTGYPSQSNDYGGVHTNNGVFNKTFYLMSDGGSFPRTNGCEINGVGRDNAINVIYKANTTYLRNKTMANHRDVYDGINQACGDIFGAESAECKNIKAAMQATMMDQQVIGNSKGPKCEGITQKPPTCSGVELPEPTGGTPPPGTTPTVTSGPTEIPEPTSIPEPTPTPTPVVAKEAQLLSTLSSPNFVAGTVKITQTGGSAKVTASLKAASLQEFTFEAPERAESATYIANQSAELGQSIDDVALEIRGRLVGKDVLDTGPFYIREDGIINEFDINQDISQYMAYEVYFEETSEYVELPILVASLSPENEDPITESGVTLDLKLKLQGINRHPPSAQAQLVRVGIGGGDLQETIYKKAVFIPDSNGIWTGRVTFDINPAVDESGNPLPYNIKIKASRHSQKKYCDANPTESGPGLYLCEEESIILQEGINSFDFSNVSQPTGDVNQDGRVNSIDIRLVRENIGSELADDLYFGDPNMDGVVNSVDDSLIIYILNNVPEQR